MRNRIIGIILVIVIVALLLVAIAVTNRDQKEPEPANKPVAAETEKPEKSSGLFAKETPEPTPEPTPTPEPKPIYTTAPEGYFEDALIIGDSRTEGIRMCADIPGATYFSSVGMGIIGAFYETVDVPGIGTVGIDTLLASKQFGKVYIMLGINDIGGDIPTLSERFGLFIEKIQTAQPEALIIIEANLRVTANYNSTMVTNARIDQFNQLISEYADNEKIFYLDVNPLFDDGMGTGLSPAISPDGLHVPGAQYIEWANWIMDHAVVFQ